MLSWYYLEQFDPQVFMQKIGIYMDLTEIQMNQERVLANYWELWVE